MLNLKKMLNGNSVRIGKDYKNISGLEIKILLYLQCISNQNNYVVLTNVNLLSSFTKLNKRTISKYLVQLEELNKIKIYGDINSYCSIEIIKDETFEIYENIEFVLDMLNDLNDAELKLYCIMSSHLNFKENKNYIYPSMQTLVKEYYANEELDEELDNKIKSINRLKNKLIEKNYIKKIVVFYFYKEDEDKIGKSSLGYFIKTGQNEVDDDLYNQFVFNQIENYNNTHSNKMALANMEYLKKCKYKNLDKYIVRVNKVEKTNELLEGLVNDESNEKIVSDEVNNVKTEKDIINLCKEIIGERSNLKIFKSSYKKIKSLNREYTDDIIYKTILWEKDNITYLCDRCSTDIHKINTIFKFIRENIDDIIKIVNRDKEESNISYDCEEIYDDILFNKVNNKVKKRRTITDIINNLDNVVNKEHLYEPLFSDTHFNEELF